MEQRLARRAHNPKVAGSSPASATNINNYTMTTKKTNWKLLIPSDRYGFSVINELERNVLMVALDHMKEHLESIADEVDVTDRLQAVY